MNSFVLSVDHLISNFTRPVVVWQVVVLLLALWAWFWVSRRLGLEGRSWPLTRRYPLLSQLRPLTNELLLFGFLILASRLLDWQTGVAGLAFFMTMIEARHTHQERYFTQHELFLTEVLG